MKSFKEDVPNLTCRFTRVSLLGVDKRDVQMPVELADKIADEIKLLLTDRIIELEKEFDAL